MYNFQFLYENLTKENRIKLLIKRKAKSCFKFTFKGNHQFL